MRFIDTDHSLQPHHGGIAAWHRTGSNSALHRHLPHDVEGADSLAAWVRGTIIGIVDYGYNVHEINYSAVNRTTATYVGAMHNYEGAPNDSDRWWAFVVPRATTQEQLAGLQAHVARAWRAGSAILQKRVEYIAGRQSYEDPTVLTAHLLGALPTLHTVGFETTGPTPASLAITGVWVPDIREP